MRLKARARGQRRPWDGEDGADFIEFCKKQELLEEEAAEGEEEGLEEGVGDDKKKDGAKKGDDETGRDADGHLTWEGIEDRLFSGEADEQEAAQSFKPKLLATSG